MKPTEFVTTDGQRGTIHHLMLIVVEHDEEDMTRISFRLTAEDPTSAAVLREFLEHAYGEAATEGEEA